MFSNVLFYLQFGFYIVELLENYLFHVFMRSVRLTRSVRLYLPSPTSESFSAMFGSLSATFGFYGSSRKFRYGT